MTRISFYVLKGNNEQDRQTVACRVVEKAYYQGLKIYIHSDNEQQIEQFNQTLWSFQTDSFIPHELAENENSNESCPVLLGHTTSPPPMMDLLINLAGTQPSFFSQFKRVAEFINDDNTIKTAGRERYRFYQQRGYELETFTI